jgi:hypothetical protein
MASTITTSTASIPNSFNSIPAKEDTSFSTSTDTITSDEYIILENNKMGMKNNMSSTTLYVPDLVDKDKKEMTVWRSLTYGFSKLMSVR